MESQETLDVAVVEVMHATGAHDTIYHQTFRIKQTNYQ